MATEFGLLPNLTYNDEKIEPTGTFVLPKISDFNEENGVETVMNIIKKWELSEKWLHCIDYIGNQEQQFDTIFTYRVCYSIPTRIKPIPKATASVYFKITKSKVRADQ
jgi:A-kinase anchor protein 14